MKHLTILTVFVLSSAAAAQEPWATYRGNPQRTGCTDDQPGPTKPRIVWSLKSKDHYVASPVPAGNRLIVSGLGAFNLPTFACLDTDPKAAARVVWSKSTPSLKLPTVSSPAVVAGQLIFGDGMHQTDGAILYCVDLETGFPIWQYPVPGHLVHLEGSPTVAGGKVYIGGGAAGVLCVDPEKLTYEGKPIDLPSVKKQQQARWKEMQAKYEQEKKVNPDFAVPPSEEQLPKAMPTLVWQQGKTKWHVDAPVAVLGDKVFVASAFLDKEQVGDRALFCLDAGTGNIVWRASLKLNPWGGPSIFGDTVVVAGSSIGYDPAKLKGAKGFVAAINKKDGSEIWSKDVTGGILSCAALANGVAVVAATDGKARAFALTDGERRWIYDAKMPLFAPPAIAKDRVYLGDLKGMVHAVDLGTGVAGWTFDVNAPGMVYGGPVVHAGRVYVATCNLEGPYARQETVVVAIGE